MLQALIYQNVCIFAKNLERKMSYLFTSESVSEGHPDKVADQISDSILDMYLTADPKSRVAAETLVSGNKVIVAGVNIKKKVIKARMRGEKHTLVEQAYPIHISNVSLIDPQSGKATRVGSRKEGAKKVRVAFPD